MASQAINLLLVWSIVAIMTMQVSAKVFYVGSPQDAEKRSGFTRQFDATLDTIQECVHSLQQPDDEYVIQPGSYHGRVNITNKHGTKDKPMIIRGDPNGQTILDGTIQLRPAK